MAILLLIKKNKEFLIIGFTIIILVIAGISLYNTALFFNLTDVYKTITGFCIFLFAWNSKKNTTDIIVQFGITFLFLSILSLLQLFINFDIIILQFLRPEMIEDTGRFLIVLNLFLISVLFKSRAALKILIGINSILLLNIYFIPEITGLFSIFYLKIVLICFSTVFLIRKKIFNLKLLIPAIALLCISELAYFLKLFSLFKNISYICSIL